MAIHVILSLKELKKDPHVVVAEGRCVFGQLPDEGAHTLDPISFFFRIIRFNVFEYFIENY